LTSIPIQHGSPRPSLWKALGACLALAGGMAPALPAAAQAGIYTCTDAQGRRITSDRPIAACLDREQRELGKMGIVRKVHPPSYTAEERAKLDKQREIEEEQLARAAEEKRRDRALLIRYPSQTVHDKERAEALSQVDEVIKAVNKREDSLVEQRKEIDTELEFYKGDPNNAPAWLRRKLEDNQKQTQVQKRFLDEQNQEKQRINARFDEELVKLRQLWSKLTSR
jgi:hypothetical protein